MIKYLSVAFAARLFSLSPQTERLYRVLGNWLEEHLRLRRGLPDAYVARSELLLELCRKYRAIHPGSKVLEIGTGWVHWDATIIALFHDVNLTLFDVWDNRLLKAYKSYLKDLSLVLSRFHGIEYEDLDKAHKKIEELTSANNFEDLYSILRAEFVINPLGKLNVFESGSFDLIVSSDVLEHINREEMKEFISDSYGLLKRGGICIHKIDIRDHFYYFDNKVSPKNYLRYSPKIWKRYFESRVQYFNRIQRSEWLNVFRESGFEIIEEYIKIEDVGNITPSTLYTLDNQDATCVDMTVICRRA